MKLKNECFEILKNERGFYDDEITLLERALEELWFKKEGEYGGEIRLRMN